MPKKPDKKPPNYADPLDAPTVALRIWCARERQGINRHQFAKMLGVAYSTANHWDDGRTEPQLAQVVRAAEILGYTVDELALGREKAAETTAPPYRAWAEFEAQGGLEGLSEQVVQELRAYRTAPGREPTVETYRRLVFASQASAAGNVTP